MIRTKTQYVKSFNIARSGDRGSALVKKSRSNKKERVPRRGDFLSRLRVLIKRQGLSKEVFPELYDE